MNRRATLRLLGGMATVGLAGCNATSPSYTPTSSTETTTPTPEDTEQPTTTSSNPPSNFERGWTGYRGNKAHTGFLEQSAAPTDFPLTQEWEFTVDSQISAAPSIIPPAPVNMSAGKSSDQTTTPSAVPGDVPVLLLGTEAGTMHAVGANAGLKIWELRYNHLQAVRTNPIVIPQAGVHIIDATATLYTINTTTGEIQDVTGLVGEHVPSMPASHTDTDNPPFGTPVATPAQFHALAGTRASPATWFTASAPHTGVFDINDTRLESLSTGKHYTVLAASPVATNTSLYTGFHSWNTRTAEQEWESLPNSDVDTQGVAIANDTVYTTTKQGVVYAFDAATGKRQWKTETGVTATQSAAVSNGRVHLKGVALDAETGREQWRTQNADQFVSTPAVADGTVFTATRNGLLVAADAATGEEQWSHDLNTIVSTAPVIAANRVYVVAGRTLYAFSP